MNMILLEIRGAPVQWRGNYQFIHLKHFQQYISYVYGRHSGFQPDRIAFWTQCFDTLYTIVQRSVQTKRDLEMRPNFSDFQNF